MTDRPEYVAALQQPEAYLYEGDPPEAIELVETHVSYLFLTGARVYKVKKAVDLGFLDFRELETRRHFCHEEVRLNRRYSPDVYLGVVPVTREGNRIALGGPGEVIDYAVKMRQLPRDRMLDALLREGTVSAEDVRRIARRIAQVHATAERVGNPDEFGGWVPYRHHVEENIAQTQPAADGLVDGAVLGDIAAYSRAFLERNRELFDRRAEQGRVVDGHGDLHAGQVCMLNGIEFIDALEFSPAYRCGDVAADIAFLAMDLDHFGRHDLSGAFVNAYVEESGDPGVRGLLPFFKCYRAHVRAKVTMMKLQAPGLPDAERAAVEADARAYFDLARSYALQALPAPALYVVMGLPGTGKSTVARGLAARWGLRRYASDVERKRMLGIDPLTRASAPPGRGIYRSSIGRRTYARLFELAEAELAAGRSVVLDATFGDPAYRERAAAVAKDHEAALWTIECVLSPGETRARIEARLAAGADPSDASVEVYERQRRTWRPVDEAFAPHHIRVDTHDPPDVVIERVVRELFNRVV